MKYMRKSLTLLLVLALLLSLSLAVFADSDSAASPAGGYVAVSGTSTQSGNYVAMTVSVRKNPDNAYLKIKIELQDNNNTVGESSSRSADGALSLARDFPILWWDEDSPCRAYGTHAVQGGSVEGAYACYTLIDLAP